MKKIDVAFFVSSLVKGGVENYLLRFLRYEGQKFGKVYIICKHGTAGVLKDEFLKFNNVSIISLKLSYFNFVNYFKLYYLIRKSEISAVCDFSGNFSGLTLFVSRLANVEKRLTFYRGSSYQFDVTFFKRVYLFFLVWLLNYSTTKYLSNSFYALDVFQPSWRNYRSDLYKVIYNGVPTYELGNTSSSVEIKSRFGFNDSDFIVGHVGNFRDAKNHICIVETARLLVKKIPTIKFFLLGKDVSVGLFEVVRKYNLQDYFIMPGSVDNIPILLSIMNVFFFPSKNEGQPNALIEAMISKVPIVASDIPTIRECVPEMLHHRLCSIDDYTSFANILIDVFHLPDSDQLLSSISDYCKIKFSPEERFSEFLKVIYEK